jgi:hypothetical protein
MEKCHLSNNESLNFNFGSVHGLSWLKIFLDCQISTGQSQHYHTAVSVRKSLIDFYPVICPVHILEYASYKILLLEHKTEI